MQYIKCNSKIHITGNMTNHMNEGLKLWQEKLLSRTKFFEGEERFVSWGSVTVDSARHIRTNVPKKTYL